MHDDGQEVKQVDAPLATNSGESKAEIGDVAERPAIDPALADLPVSKEPEGVRYTHAAGIPRPSIGRIGHYTLCESDVEEINRRRTTSQSIRDRIGCGQWPLGAQAHIGNSVVVGQIVPAVVVNIFGDGNTLNLHCLLDGTDTFWALSRLRGESPGQWTWPPRI